MSRLPSLLWPVMLGMLLWAAAPARAQGPEPDPGTPPPVGAESVGPEADASRDVPLTGEFEVVEAPGFLVHYQNCDGTLPTADRLTLPRRLSSRYTDMSATVRAGLTDGRPSDITLVAGDEPLFEAVRWHVERARFATGEPACVTLHYRVVDTVRKAADMIDFRVWVDVALRADGSVESAALADELADEGLAAVILSQVRTWQLEPTVRDGAGVPVETSLRVDVHLEPSGWTTYTVTTGLARRGPRPTKVAAPRFPPRVDSALRRGSVVLEFMVSEDGRPVAPRIVEAEPPGVFDRYALAAIKRWRFKPDTIDGQVEMTGPVRQVLRFDATQQERKQLSDPPRWLRDDALRRPPRVARPPTDDY